MNPKKQFDVVIMNPPYNAPQVIRNDKGITGGGTTLWDKFIDLGMTLLNEEGHLVSINPSGWRQPQHSLWLKLRGGLKYIEMHSHKDGARVFGKGTNYDMLVWGKSTDLNCLVVDEHGDRITLDISQIGVLPNHSLDVFAKIIAKPAEPRIEMLHSYSLYERRKPWMNKESKGKFQYPCIYMINSKNEPTLYFSSKQHGHFGVPKVIFATGCSSGFILDKDGQFGLTDFAAGIVDEPRNLPHILRGLQSDKWKELRTALFIAGNGVDRNAFACLRKDFWKEFL